MIVLLSAVVLVLAIAIVVLFAMLGELASRVPEPSRPWVEPLEDAKLGRIPSVWPSELSNLVGRERTVLLVLSTVCSSCKAIAADLKNHAKWGDAALIVSTAELANGRAFLAAQGLDSFTHYIDEGGDWVRGEFGVATSPTALVFHGSRLVSAYVFSDIAALRSALHDQIDNSNGTAAIITRMEQV